MAGMTNTQNINDSFGQKAMFYLVNGTVLMEGIGLSKKIIQQAGKIASFSHASGIFLGSNLLVATGVYLTFRIAVLSCQNIINRLLEKQVNQSMVLHVMQIGVLATSIIYKLAEVL